MPLRSPTTDETQSEWMSYCIRELRDEGSRERSQEQMVAICLSAWRDGQKEKFADLVHGLHARLILDCWAKQHHSENQPRQPEGAAGGIGGQFAPEGEGVGGGPAPGPTVHSSAGPKVRAGVDAVPAEHLAVLKDAVVSEHQTVRGLNRELLGLARYDPYGTVIQVAREANGAKSRDMTGVTVHELGHALDKSTGFALSSRFASTISADAAKMSALDRNWAAHFLKNEREMFAETYRLAHSPAKKGGFGLSQKKAERIFATSIAAVKELTL